MELFFFTNNETLRVKSAREFYDGKNFVVEYITLDGETRTIAATDVFVQK